MFLGKEIAQVIDLLLGHALVVDWIANHFEVLHAVYPYLEVVVVEGPFNCLVNTHYFIKVVRSFLVKELQNAILPLTTRHFISVFQYLICHVPA